MKESFINSDRTIVAHDQSARNARQMVNHTPCFSQSRSCRQQVAGEGNSSGKSRELIRAMKQVI